MKETTSSINIFALSDEDLYDDEEVEEQDSGEKKRKKGSRRNRTIILSLIAVVLSIIIAVAFAIYGISQHNAFVEAEAKFLNMQKDVQSKSDEIAKLNMTITAKDAEIENLKKQQQSQEQGKTDGKSSSPSSSSSSGSFPSGQHNYVVTDVKGFNIREGAGYGYEVVASLANGESFTSTGDLITDADGNIWIELLWDNGFGCLQSSSGEKFVKLID